MRRSIHAYMHAGLYLPKWLVSVSFLLFLSLSVFAFQADRTVTGSVKDSNGNPVEGATVMVKGSSNGTTTNANGEFSIEAPSNAVLVFSLVGYSTQELSVAGKSSVGIVLQTSESSLSEVVVTGFGDVAKKKKIGYAVTEIKGDILSGSNENNIVNSMQGRVPGMQISRSANGVSGSSRVILRGNNSVSGSNQALFVIDGVLMDNPDILGSQDYGNALSNLNPDDFESITVLKGPTAAALYGSRAANGVIVIKSKRGTAQKGLGVTYRTSLMRQQVLYGPEFQNVYGAGNPDMQVLGGTPEPNNIELPVGTDGVPYVPYFWGHSWGARMDGQQARAIDGVMRPYSPQSKNFVSAFDHGLQTDQNLTIEGGNEKTTLRINGGYMNKKGITPNNKMDLLTLSSRVTHNVNKNLKIDLGTTVGVRNVHDAPYASLDGRSIANTMMRMGRDFPFEAIRDEKTYRNTAEGGLNGAVPNGGLFWELYENTQTLKENTLRADLDISYEAASWLRFVVRGNINNSDQNMESRNRGTGVGNTGGYFGVSEAKVNQSRIQALAYLNKDFGEDFTVSGFVGGEQWRTVTHSSFGNTVGGLLVPNVFNLNNSIERIASNFSKVGEKQINGIYGSVQFSWRDFLYLEATGRNDWSSTLTRADGTGNNSYFYPSVNSSFVFTDAFKIDNSILSFGRIRASWAEVGNDAPPYQLRRDYANQGIFDEGGRNVQMFGLAGSTIPPVDLKPEQTRAVEIGTNLRFWKDRIDLDFTWYRQVTINQILNSPVSRTSGAPFIFLNAGDVSNKGIEGALSITPVKTSKARWTVTFNYARNRNSVLRLAPQVHGIVLGGMDGIYAAAHPRGYFPNPDDNEYGLITMQGNQRYQARDAEGNAIDHPSNGQFIVNPANGTYLRTNDYPFVGKFPPNWTGGLVNTFTYKNFGISAVIDIRSGGQVFSWSYIYGIHQGTLKETLQGRSAETGGVQWTDAAGRVRNDGIIPKGVYPQGYIDGTGKDRSGEPYDQAMPAAMYWFYLGHPTGALSREKGIVSSSYVSLREVSLSYMLPGKILTKTPLKQLSIVLVARNAGYLYAGMPARINPEGLFNTGNGSLFEAGGEPVNMSYGATLSARF